MADIRIDFGFDDLNQAKQVAKELQKAAKNITAAMKATGKVVQADLKKARDLAKATKKVATEKKKLTAVEKEQLRLERALAATEAKLKLASSATNRTLIEKRKQLLAVNRLLRTGSKNTAGWSQALGSFQFKFNALGNIAANVSSTITRSFSRAMRGAIKTILDFEQAMADVRAITQATDKEFKQLGRSARDLGGSTKFTASEVAKLQKEYAKLGFSTEEIINAQGATLDLAAAFNTELPRAAEVVGITIRQFGLNASETQRVVDVMAKSFATSALDIEKFAESMKFVGPAAKASGISVERTTAMLAQLADAGISASLGGTALRRIFTLMAIGGHEASERIRELSIAEIGLAEASQEVQQRAATALLVLADGVGTIDDYTEALKRSAGVTKEMAEIQLETLRGQITILKAGWDRYIQALATSDEQFQLLKATLAGTSLQLNDMADRVEENKEETTGLNKALQGLWKGIQLGLPILGNFKRGADEMRGALNEVEQAAEDARLEFALLNAEIDSTGGVAGFFEIPPEDVKVLEDITKLLDKLDEFRFEEEDQEAITLDISKGITLSEGTADEAKKRIEDLAKQQSDAVDQSVKEAQEAEDAKLKAEQDAADKREKIIAAGFAAAGNITNAFANLFEAAKQKELSAAGDNAAERLKIEQEFAKKQQLVAVGQTIINTAEGITKTFADLGFIPGLPFAIALAAAGAVQLAVIKNQKFGEGEVDISGASHSRGGIAAEIEGGESVINKRSTGKYKGLLEAINQDDQVRIAAAMSRDKKITVNNAADPYSRKLYELMRSKETYGEDGKFYYKHKNGVLYKARK